ncbi:MAG: hypothetical protein DSZ29_03525, partial [Aquificaceae bacterium]
MNRTMVKRGIGAAALAIVAALLLGYLLKGKNQERQEVVDMTLPGAQEVKKSLNIPSLGSNNSAKDAVKNTADAAKNAAGGAGETVIASADGLGNAANENIKTKKTAVNTYENKGKDLDFTIRPPKGEKRQVVDNIGKSKQEYTQEAKSVAATANKSSSQSAQQNTGSISRPTGGSVVASTGANSHRSSSEHRKPVYRPRLVDERKRSASYGLATTQSSKKSQHQTKAKKHIKTQKATSKASKKSGYSIQLLATSSSSRANNLKKVMKKEGYKSFVSKTTKA